MNEGVVQVNVVHTEFGPNAMFRGHTTVGFVFEVEKDGARVAITLPDELIARAISDAACELFNWEKPATAKMVVTAITK